MDELSVMDGSKCVLQLRGVRPFLSDKYDITKHPNYRYLSDADPKYAFDIGKFVSTRLKVRVDEEYSIFDFVPANEDMPDAAFGDFSLPNETADEPNDIVEYEEDLEPI
jgi:type IV secretion system protein VirD4